MYDVILRMICSTNGVGLIRSVFRVMVHLGAFARDNGYLGMYYFVQVDTEETYTIHVKHKFKNYDNRNFHL